jgi:hypothetical protein
MAHVECSAELSGILVAPNLARGTRAFGYDPSCDQ